MAVNIPWLPLIILLPLSSAQAPRVHPVELDKVAIATKLIEVLVILPVVWIIIPFTLVAGHFIEDAEVFNVIFRIKLLLNRFNQFFLLVGHIKRIINIC